MSDLDIPNYVSTRIKLALKHRLPADQPVGHVTKNHPDGTVDVEFTPEAADIVLDVLGASGILVSDIPPGLFDGLV